MFRLEYCHYNHQIREPEKFPGVALFKVFTGEQLCAVVREIRSETDLPEERGADLRVECHEDSGALRTFLDGAFPGRELRYFAQGAGWQWRDNGTYETMPWT